MLPWAGYTVGSVVQGVNLPALTDGASGLAVWLELPGIASITPPQPTGLVLINEYWWMSLLASAC